MSKHRNDRVYPPHAEYLPDLTLPGGVTFYNVVPDGGVVRFFVADANGFIENAQRRVMLARSTWDALVHSLRAAEEAGGES